MNIYLDHTNTKAINGTIAISGSKSESNRLLILQKLFPFISVENLSNSDDTQYLKNALNSTLKTIDIGHAGTAMRFLTAYFATQDTKNTILTGSSRMQKRPIKILVDALLDIGADISYLYNEGYPPLVIKGRKLLKNKVSIKGNVSSQYISALLLLAPSLQNGLEINLKGEITSVPYINMTLSLLKKIGVITSFIDQIIQVKSLKTTHLQTKILSIEPDWSSVSYYYSLAALQPNTSIELIGFKEKSLQGDSILPEIYKQLGVETTFAKKGIILKSSNSILNFKPLTLNLIKTPDLAQTIAVTCLGLGIKCHLTGLHTLKIKETDRLVALKNEFEKLGAKVQITTDSFQLLSSESIKKNITIKTYDDHRMAMAFAPLSVKIPIKIENPEVVSKSYPNFWTDWKHLLGEF